MGPFTSRESAAAGSSSHTDRAQSLGRQSALPPPLLRLRPSPRAAGSAYASVLTAAALPPVHVPPDGRVRRQPHRQAVPEGVLSCVGACFVFVVGSVRNSKHAHAPAKPAHQRHPCSLACNLASLPSLPSLLLQNSFTK